MIDFDELALGPCMDAFGLTVTFVPAEGDEAEITGIFQDAYTHIRQDAAGDPITTTSPAIGCRASDFAAEPVAEDRFTILGTTYRVIDVLQDGVGHLQIILMRAP